MKVAVIAKSPEWLNTIYTAIRTCKSSFKPSDIAKAVTMISDKEKIRLVMACYRAGHTSVLEHATITYAIDGISRACLSQLTRHRIGVSFSVQSQRYVDATIKPEFINPLPDTSGEYGELNEIYAGMLKRYETLLKSGVKREDARNVLPMGICTNLVLTVNLRSLLDLYEKRVVKKGAQAEIKTLVKNLCEAAVNAEPWLEDMFTSGVAYGDDS